MTIDEVREFVRRAKAALETGRCAWCATHPGQTHRDAQGQALTDLRHQSGVAIDAETADRISRDGV